LVPLLRIVKFAGEKGQIVSQTFRPYYSPINKLDFDAIEILLCNELGEENQFECGESIVILHFRTKT